MYEFPVDFPDVGDKIRLTQGEAVLESQVVGRRFFHGCCSVILADGSAAIQEAEGWTWCSDMFNLDGKNVKLWQLLRIP